MLENVVAVPEQSFFLFETIANMTMGTRQTKKEAQAVTSTLYVLRHYRASLETVNTPAAAATSHISETNFVGVTFSALVKPRIDFIAGFDISSQH